MPQAPSKPISIERWKRMAKEYRAEAEKLPQGRAHDAMMKKVRQLETACEINEWLASPGLRSPIGSSSLQLKPLEKAVSQ